jgi:hypothetical protein
MADESIPALEPMREQAKRERRVSVRIPSRRYIHCQPRGTADLDIVCPAIVQNVSRVGISMAMRRSFELDTELLVELSDRADALLRLFQVRVIHATPGGNRRWIIGCQFVSPLSDEEFLTLADASL